MFWVVLSVSVLNSRIVKKSKTSCLIDRNEKKGDESGSSLDRPPFVLSDMMAALLLFRFEHR